MKYNIVKAKKHWARLKEIVSKRESPFSHMREEDIIKKIRKDRKAIWESKLAARS